VEPQLLSRLDKADYICGEQFSAVDCVMGQNVLWARAYGLCQPTPFADYVGRLSQRAAFTKAYADLGNFSLAPPAGTGGGLASLFTG
jgi:glutathione S-transferase